jgi:hypothetical protein
LHRDVVNSMKHITLQSIVDDYHATVGT